MTLRRPRNYATHTTDLERRITGTGGDAMALQRWWLPAMLVGVSIQLSTPLLRQNNCTLSGWNMRFLSVRFSGRPVIDRFMMIRPSRTEMPGEGEKNTLVNCHYKMRTAMAQRNCLEYVQFW